MTLISQILHKCILPQVHLHTDKINFLLDLPFYTLFTLYCPKTDVLTYKKRVDGAN